MAAGKKGVKIAPHEWAEFYMKNHDPVYTNLNEVFPDFMIKELEYLEKKSVKSPTISGEIVADHIRKIIDDFEQLKNPGPAWSRLRDPWSELAVARMVCEDLKRMGIKIDFKGLANVDRARKRVDMTLHEYDDDKEGRK